MADRDPRTDPREGDELIEMGGSRVLINAVEDDTVCYRVTDGDGGLLGAFRCAIEVVNA